MNKYESLHNHTSISDGTQTHLEVLDVAEQYGFGVIAFTDHDVLPNEEQLQKLRAYSGPVKWLIGCEISSGLPKELGGGPTSMFHILGLLTDPFNKKLLEHSKKALQGREERMNRIVANLRELGFKMTVEDCLNASGGESVGRPHIVKALFEYEENVRIIEKIREDMEHAAQTDENVRAQYENMLQRNKERGIKGYPYQLFLSEDSFIQGIYVDYLYSINMDQSVELIRGAGGVAVLAHWPTIAHKIPADMLQQFLQEKRLDGVEVVSGFVGEEEDAKMRMLGDIVKKAGAIQTAGVDAHIPEAFESFAISGYAEKTIGITDSIVTRVKPSLEWTNF